MSDQARAKAAPTHTISAATFTELVESLAGDYDLIEVLTLLTSRCVELLAAGAAGILLADRHGCLCVVGASSEQAQLLELFQIQNDEGPCLDCYGTGQVVRASDLNSTSSWPLFATECVRAGFGSVCAVPLRLRGHTLGCLNLFVASPSGLADTDVALAQTLADFASIALIHDQATRQAAVREDQLQGALTSRIVIEQAKGMIAEGRNVDMNEAFDRLRTYARNSNRRLTEVSESVVAGAITVDDIAPRQRHPRPTST